MEYEITDLRTGVVVRPKGALGTCGWIAGKAWQAAFFPNRAKALRHIDKVLGRLQ